MAVRKRLLREHLQYGSVYLILPKMKNSIRRRFLSVFASGSQLSQRQWIRRPDALQNLVVCVSSNSESSAAAFKSACDIASHSHAHVSALHVPKSQQESQVSSIAGCSESSKVSLDVVSRTTSIKKTIVDELRQRHPDLCLIGADRSGSGLFSTVQYVTKNAPCDVLVVRDDGLWHDGPMKAIVCFGINDWEGSIEAFRAALRIAKPGDEIEAVHVVHSWNTVDAVFGPPMMPPQGNGTTEDKIAKALEKVMLDALNENATRLGPDDVNIRPVVLFAGVDNPTKVLVDYASSNKANLVSVGVGCIGRIFNPVNFSYYLTHKSPCSVLVARRSSEGVPESVPTEPSTQRKNGAGIADFYVDDPEEWFLRKSSI